MIKMAAPNIKKIPRKTRATTAAAMSIATTAIVITSICPSSPPPFCFRVDPPFQAHTRDLWPHPVGLKSCFIAALQTPNQPKAAHPVRRAKQGEPS